MKERIAAAFLLLLGSLHMLGYAIGSERLRGVAALTCASPAPKVFSAVKGLETYSTKFRIEWLDPFGAPQALDLKPEVYARLEGPYNRRNVYGSVLAFGPILATDPKTQAMHAAVMRHAACGDRPLLSELGIDPRTVSGKVRVVLEPRPGTAPGLPLALDVSCP
jgi:hypothetical protein